MVECGTGDKLAKSSQRNQITWSKIVRQAWSHLGNQEPLVNQSHKVTERKTSWVRKRPLRNLLERHIFAIWSFRHLREEVLRTNIKQIWAVQRINTMMSCSANFLRSDTRIARENIWTRIEMVTSQALKKNHSTSHLCQRQSTFLFCSLEVFLQTVVLTFQVGRLKKKKIEFSSFGNVFA